MTVIAFDGKTLAADKRSISSGMISTVTKVRRIGDLLCAGCGEMPVILAMFEWIANGRVASDLPADQRSKDDWSTVVVIDGGKILKYDRGAHPVHIENAFFAAGSGREFALAAMHCGKSAREAVEIASIYENGCGNGVDELHLTP
jgi:ATP-dependent protease HslVU (ClpYQ) peptidase subunit